jgi:hypothetical protein
MQRGDMMKKEELIKLGLTEEQASAVLAAYTDATKDLVSSAELTTAKEENDRLNGIIKERDNQLDTLKKSVGDNEELKATIEKLKADNKTAAEKYSSDIKHIKVENAVESAIRASKGRNSKAIRALLDIDESKVTVAEDGSLVGLNVDKQLEKLVKGEDSAFLFESGSGIKGIEPGRSNGEPQTGVFPENGSYEEMAAFFDANPNYTL